MIQYTPKKADNVADAFQQLYEILSMLRSKDGCPYDRALTTEEALQNLQDESYEYLDGCQKKDISLCREEIGDVLINALMLLRIHEEAGDFLPQDAINEAVEKLYRRHDHVFGSVQAKTEDEALAAYQKAKQEKEGRKSDAKSIFAHIPSSLPPMEKCFEIQKKLEKFGFDWPDAQGVADKVHEELSEVEEAMTETDPDHLEEELGDLLTAVVNLCRYLHVRPNAAMHRANQKMTRRFTSLFELAEKRGIPLDKDHVQEMNDLWDEVKASER